ncbi:peptidoglycan DD-metalloendopeptidase family protein [Acuticoccus sp. MNP-M23]|uniref:murein hydrolase activator EnvC family protein n=1 Tax=Acuticoccus sp. MNP-M23 TaxID=3072793 RepID=UPI0028149C32|nr:peptidoglycan DD-metalloendopeptidase family protein [Acuticoccus sp. MNP-M23]WMS42675.1 peptidoglycan DD-metalloendopeptidase family protein [Acuticoccus sp. MNP-M23]
MLALGLAVPWAHAQPLPQDEAAREREQLLTRLERLREETEATQARANTLGETLVDLAGDEAKLRQRLDESGARVAVLEGRIASDEVALEDLSSDQAAIRHKLAGKRKELATVLMALQRLGRSPPPALFASADGPSDVVRGAILLNAVIPGLDAEARELTETLNEVARLESDEESRWARLRTDLSDVTEERDRLAALVEELGRRRALSLYERDRASADLARLAEEADSVETLLERLSKGGIEAPETSGVPFADRRGNLPPPVAGTAVSRYGDPTATGAVATGRTIAALAQSTVFAPMPATVLYAAPFRTYGHVLILDAGDGYHMVLTGLAESFVNAGASVKAGTPLGRMGLRAGRTALADAAGAPDAVTRSRPLLYVELRRDGMAIDSHGWWRDHGPDGGRTTE